MFEQWSRLQRSKQRRAAERRITPGDGRALKPFRWWQQIARMVFYLPLDVGNGRQVVYAIDVHYLHQLLSRDGRGKAALYADGTHLAESRLPAAFPVPGGAIEVVPAPFGLSRCHLVTIEGHEYPLVPDPESADGRRARVKHDHPLMSRLIGTASVIAIFVPLSVLTIQLTEVVLDLPSVTARFGAFSPLLDLPTWLNVVLASVVAVAGTERLIRFRHKWVVESVDWDSREVPKTPSPTTSAHRGGSEQGEPVNP